ncbi:MAG: 8-amino-7-oxononanoate synthase [Oceanisphaera sp.]|nr:8-amino-7-oxononanoate synthase [Oceanisphaera sp.]
MKDLAAELEKRRQQGLYRSRRIHEGPQAPVMIIDGRPVLSFCSNDYLGLANHPEVVKAFQSAANNYGVGAGAAHLVNGHSRVHHELEDALAEYTGRERALLFSTGYMANLGVASALLGRGDTVIEDRLNHASLIDAGLLSGARLQRYIHADVSSLASKLTVDSDRECLVMTDGVFSMDGDIAPLPELAAVASKHEAWFMVDDAHGIGVLGERGRGSLEHFGLSQTDVPILMGTLGKALGTAGAFVAGSEDLVEYLIQSARTYIYTTAMPAAVAAATLASLRLVESEGWRREKLQTLITRFRKGVEQLGLELMPSSTPIQPLVVGDAGHAVAMSEALLERDILVTAIRPPTVPQGTARLRFTFSAEHGEEQVDQLLGALSQLQ